MFGNDPQLLRKDLCDRCVARAVVHAVLKSGLDLHFCNHHYQQVSQGLEVAASALTFDLEEAKV